MPKKKTSETSLDDIKKLIINQNKRIDSLTNRISILETSSDKLEVEDKLINQDESAEIQKTDETKEEIVEKKSEEQSEEKISDKENSTNIFKVFGGVGVIMILLGIIYFYKYAIENEWIGITGRIVTGIFVSLIFILTGIIFYKKDYEKFSQVILAGGLGILYFTMFATYHFPTYRRALGMNLTLNTFLCLAVMIIGLIIGLRLDKKFIVFLSSVLGFLAAFLSGIDGATIHIIIYVLLIDSIFLAIAKIKGWFAGLPVQILTYVAYIIWLFFSFSSRGMLNNSNYPILISFTLLGCIYLLFTVYSFVQTSKFKELEGVGLHVLNSIALGAFAMVVAKYHYELRGLYLILCAAIILFVGFLAKKRGFEKIFLIEFLATFVTVAVAIPVQFDYSVVTILWVLVMLGLAYAGKSVQDKRLYLLGFLGYLLPLLRILLFDFWFDSDLQRWLSVGAGLLGLLVLIKINYVNKNQKPVFNKTFYSIIGNILGIIWLVIEVNNFFRYNESLFVSIFCALYAIITIFFGVHTKKKYLNWLGIIFFGIVVAKVLFFDIMTMDNIIRVIVLILVGLLALIGSFLFVKNRDKIKEEFL